MIITSLQNPRIKALVGLQERRKRDSSGLCLVEGFEEISLALQSSIPLRELYICPALFPDPTRQNLIVTAKLLPSQIFEVNERVFEKIAYRENPDGWLGVFALPVWKLHEIKLSRTPFLVICEAVEKPGNLGAILRTADAAGVDVLISCDPRTDWHNPNVVRASKGALFTVQVSEASTTETIAWLKAQGIQIVVATPQATEHYTRADLRHPVAIVVGTEKEGVSQQWLDAATTALAIPMFGRVNSLNVATATALLIYEVVRQRTELA